ncbi:hypothetical protein D3C80_1017840 [compost metagenome]
MALGDVAALGGGAVGADVADVGGLESGLGQRHLHAQLHGLLLGLGHVGGVAVGGKAHQLGDDGGPARLRMFQLLQHQGACPLANHQPVPLPIERSRRQLGVVVHLAGGKQGVEHHGLRRAELLGPAGHHQGLIAVLDRLKGVANALAAGGAGAGGRDHPPAQTEEEACIDRRRVRHHLYIGGGRDAGGALVVEHDPEGADGLRAADGGAIGDAGATIGQHGVVGKSRPCQRQFGGHGRQLGDSPHGPRLLARIVGGQHKVGNGRRQPGVEPLVDGPFRHGHHRIAPRLQLCPHARPVLAERRHPGHAGYHYPLHTIPPFAEISWRATETAPC